MARMDKPLREVINGLEAMVNDGEGEYNEVVFIVAEYPDINYVLAYRNSKYQPWVAAWAYNGKNSWGQGHYFENLEDAIMYIQDKRIAERIGA